MAGRHAIRGAALNALDTPVIRTAAAAMTMGAMLGVAMPTSQASEEVSGAEAVAALAVANTTEAEDVQVPSATEPVQAPADGNLSVSSTNSEDATQYQIEVELPQAPEPEVVDTPAEAPVQAEAPVAQQTVQTPAQTPAQEPVAQQAQAPAAAPAQAPAANAAGIRAQILAYARQFIGTPYVFGGATPGGFDCSGFVSYVFNANGFSMGRTTGAMAAQYRQIPASQAQPGDLVMWGTYHVGIYTGNGMHIAAHRPGKPLSEAPLYGSYYFLRVIG